MGMHRHGCAYAWASTAAPREHVGLWFRLESLAEAQRGLAEIWRRYGPEIVRHVSKCYAAVQRRCRRHLHEAGQQVNVFALLTPVHWVVGAGPTSALDIEPTLTKVTLALGITPRGTVY